MLIWKSIFVFYALFVLTDVVSLFSRDPFFPTGVGSLLGVLAAVPIFGYAFCKRIANARMWQVLFTLQVVFFLFAIGALISAHIRQVESIEFSPYLILLIPAVFILFFPWFMYAFRSPGIWRNR